MLLIFLVSKSQFNWSLLAGDEKSTVSFPPKWIGILSLHQCAWVTWHKKDEKLSCRKVPAKRNGREKDSMQNTWKDPWKKSGVKFRLSICVVTFAPLILFFNARKNIVQPWWNHLLFSFALAKKCEMFSCTVPSCNEEKENKATNIAMTLNRGSKHTLSHYFASPRKKAPLSLRNKFIQKSW